MAIFGTFFGPYSHTKTATVFFLDPTATGFTLLTALLCASSAQTARRVSLNALATARTPTGTPRRRSKNSTALPIPPDYLSYVPYIPFLPFGRQRAYSI